MFRDRAFNFSFLFSGAWHLCWIVAIGIVITPSVQPSNIYQEVDFLGPILEKTAFDLMAEEAKPQAETLYASSRLFFDNVYLKPMGPQRKVRKEFKPDVTGDKLFISPENYAVKDAPVYFAEEVKMAREMSAGKNGALWLEGPAKARGIVSKPKPPTVPRGLYGDRNGYLIKLKFFLSDNGMVYDVKPIVSSGYPEIDLQAIRFVKSWRFSASGPSRKEGASTWGIATVTVKTE